MGWLKNNNNNIMLLLLSLLLIMILFYIYLQTQLPCPGPHCHNFDQYSHWGLGLVLHYHLLTEKKKCATSSKLNSSVCITSITCKTVFEVTGIFITTNVTIMFPYFEMEGKGSLSIYFCKLQGTHPFFSRKLDPFKETS